MKLLLLFVLTSLLSFHHLAQSKIPKVLKKSYFYVPSGNVILEEDTVSVQGFYMYFQEVTNANYQEFLNWIEKEGTEKMKKTVQIQHQNWTSEEASFTSEALAEKYHTHPAYREFPVVNVSQEAALLYCQWLEEVFEKEYNLKVKVRLPYHAEFIRAGAGSDLTASYAWKGLYMRNSEGQFLANFTRIPQSTISRNKNGTLEIQTWKGKVSNSADLTAPSMSYFPSEYGLYNLNGNVAEMINEEGIAVGGSWMDYGYDIRLQSRKAYTNASCDIGFRPVFTIVK